MKVHQDIKIPHQDHDRKMPIYIFTECNLQIGYGHITRCISLYDECIIRGLRPQFVLNSDAGDFTEVLQGRNCLIGDWYRDPWKVARASLDDNKYAIVDSYLADIDVYKSISDSVAKQNGIAKAVYIDDTNRIAYPSGIIVNPSFFGEHLDYDKRENQIYLLGSKYIILRKEFYDIPKTIESRKEKKTNIRIKNILIMMGGADVKNLTPQIMNTLNNSDEYNSCMQHVIIGKGFHSIHEIEKQKKSAKLYYNLSAAEIRDLMLYCDIAISAAGQTVYELIATKLPFVCIKVVDNQENNIQGLLKYNIITEYLDFENKTDAQMRDELVQIPRMIGQAPSLENDGLIGKGAENIMQELMRSS